MARRQIASVRFGWLLSALFAIALVATVISPSARAEGEKEYALSAGSECVYAPEFLNGTGSGSVAVKGTGPQRVVPTDELSVVSNVGTITLPEGLANILHAFGGTEVRGNLTRLVLDLEGLEEPSLNIADAEGFPAGLTYAAAIQPEQTITLTLPASGSFTIGPQKVTGHAGEEVKLTTDHALAYTPFEQEGERGYRATGHGVVLSLSAYNASHEHVLGPFAVDCTAESESVTTPIDAPPENTTAPSNVSLPTISGTAQEARTLTAHHGTWAGTASISYAYHWQRCVSGTCNSIEGATASTYQPTHADVGDTLRVRVAATNVAGSSAAFSAETATVEPWPPENKQRPEISGEVGDGLPLSATAGVWEGAPTISKSFQWESCDIEGENCTTIFRGTESTFTPTAANIGGRVRVRVTASNPGGSSEVTSEPSPVVPALPASEKEYKLNAKSECVAGPGLYNATGEGELELNARGPISAYPEEELSLGAATSTIKLPESVAADLYPLGVREVRGELENLVLDAEHLQTGSLNIAFPPGFSAGLTFRAPLELGKPTALFLPAAGVFGIGPDRVTGAVGQRVVLHPDTAKAFEHYSREGESGYEATGEGIARPGWRPSKRLSPRVKPATPRLRQSQAPPRMDRPSRPTKGPGPARLRSLLDFSGSTAKRA